MNQVTVFKRSAKFTFLAACRSCGAIVLEFWWPVTQLTSVSLQETTDQ